MQDKCWRMDAASGDVGKVYDIVPGPLGDGRYDWGYVGDGGNTVIGRGTTVSGNVFLLQSTPPGSMVTRAEGGVMVRTRETPGFGMGI